MRQPYEIALAARYLSSSNRNGFISLISVASMAGVGLAVAVLIIVLSVMNGFESELQRRILGVVSHASVLGIDGPLQNWEDLREQALGRNDISAAAPFVEGQGMLVAGELIAGINVRGIDIALESQVSSIEDLLRTGDLEVLYSGNYRILIGSSLADSLNVGMGDPVVLLIAQATVTPAGILPRMRTFTVGGIFEAGIYEYDRGLAFINMEDAAKLFRTEGRATGLRLAVKDIYFASQVVREFAVESGGNVYVTDWTRQYSNFFRSIQLTKNIMFVLLSLVILVATFNIVSTLVMVVRDKRGDVAILRSMGVKSLSVMTIFASQGAFIGLVGTGLGLALGLLVAGQIEILVSVMEGWFGIDLLSAEVYLISDLPTQIRIKEVAGICLIAFILAVLATVYPAITAAQQRPSEVLRYE